MLIINLRELEAGLPLAAPAVAGTAPLHSHTHFISAPNTTQIQVKNGILAYRKRSHVFANRKPS